MYSFRDLSNYYVLFIKSSIKSNDLDYMGVMGRRIANLVPEKNCSESWQKNFWMGGFRSTLIQLVFTVLLVNKVAAIVNFVTASTGRRHSFGRSRVR